MINKTLIIFRYKVFFLKGLKKTQRLTRLLQISVAVALMVGLFQLWETSLLQGQQLLKSQTQKMARLLVQQTAYGAAPALQLQNDEQLQWLTSALVLDPKVMSATIFSEKGQRLAFAQSVTDEPFEPESEELRALLAPYPPYVEAVLQDDKNLGYIEVRLVPQRFFNEIKEAHQLNMEQQQMMLIIAGLIGMLLSRALSFKRADFERRKTKSRLGKKITATLGTDKEQEYDDAELSSDAPDDTDHAKKGASKNGKKDDSEANAR